VFLHHFVHIPWSQSDSWRVLPTMIRDEIYRGILCNDIVGFHTQHYTNNFLQCCEDLMGYDVDFERGAVAVRGPRGMGPDLSAADRSPAPCRAWRLGPGPASSRMSSCSAAATT